MSEIPAAYTEFGQTLAFTERTLSAVLRQHLAEREVEPETWYALKLIAARGPGAAREGLIRDLGSSPTFDLDAAADLLVRLRAEGLIDGEAEVDLTARGRAEFDSLRDHVVGATVELLGQFDLGDIETTVRTLRAVTQRAEQQTAAA
jgi:hypothetical protein